MYLIELIIKKFFAKKSKEPPIGFEPEDIEEELHRNCESHIYLPIDSACDFLACKNCGHILRNHKKDNNHDTNQDLFDKF